MFQFTTDSKPASIISDDLRTCDLQTAPVYRSYLHTRVTVQTLCYGQQEGEILAVVPSPFPGETHMMAFVSSLPGQPAWTDYVPLKQTPEYNACDCADCGKHGPESLFCPECGLCLSCCDCPPSPLDDWEYPDYCQEDTGEDAAFDDYHDRQALLNFRIGH